MNPSEAPTSWQLAVLCGPQGVGKSTLTAQLAQRSGATTYHFDDYVADLRATTQPEQYPNLHYRTVYPEVGHGHPEFVNIRFRVAKEVLPLATALLGDLTRQPRPAVLEGDYLLPLTQRPSATSVVAWAVIVECDADVVVRNLLAREPHLGPQVARAKTTLAVGARLQSMARRIGVPVVEASPHETAIDRLEFALAHPRPAVH